MTARTALQNAIIAKFARAFDAALTDGDDAYLRWDELNAAQRERTAAVLEHVLWSISPSDLLAFHQARTGQDTATDFAPDVRPSATIIIGPFPRSTRTRAVR